MPTAPFVIAAALTLCAGPVCLQLDPQDSSNAEQESREELEERLRPLYEKAIETRLNNRIDYANDTLEEIRAKEQTVRRAGSELYSATYEDFADYSLFVLDYTLYRKNASPRLSGRVIRVGPAQKYTDLSAIEAVLQRGDLVIVDAGAYSADLGTGRGRPAPWAHVAVVGQGSEATYLKIPEIDHADRLRLEGLNISTNDDYFTDLRSNASMHLRNVRISGYNIGAGGSVGLSADDGWFLIEDCLFDGRPGRAQGNLFGNATRFNPDTNAYFRHTQFIDNGYTVDAGSLIVVDGCVAISEYRHTSGPPRDAYIRKSRMPEDHGIPFTHATDDLAFVKFAATGEGEIDETSRRIIELRRLDQSVPYWLELIRHENPELRRIAAAMFTRLTGENAEPHAEGQKEDETLADLGVLFKAELEYTRLATWLEAQSSNDE